MNPRWSPATGCRESLAAALHALLARDEIELAAVLGLGAAIVASQAEPPGVWHTLARDVNLLDTAALYGLRLRELHPRGAARELSTSAEFAAHFHDSYLPLIERALAAGQIALAWRGWPPPGENEWGLVTHVEAGVPVGRSVSLVSPVPLTGPAHQVYVVEERFAVAGPDATALFHAALRATRAFWAPAEAADTLARGAAAWEAWSATPGEQIRDGVAALAESRRRLADWLARIEPQLDPVLRKTASDWRAVARATAELLQRPAGDTLRAAATLERDWQRLAGLPNE